MQSRQAASALPLGKEEFSDLKDGTYFELGRRPLPAVLDTACVRTGLHFQIKNGSPPASVTTARNGWLRLFMEYDTLVETNDRLPKFASQLGVPESELRRILNDDWLPHVSVVKLPPAWREIDPRALAVRDRDTDDYPTAALAALLSPCILLTHNHKHFGALGVSASSQGVEGVLATIEIRDGQLQEQTVFMIPTIPIRAVGAATQWAARRIGPAAWIILGLSVAGGAYLYLKQPQEKQERVKQVAAQVGMQLLGQYTQATAQVRQARTRLRGCLVPKPELRSPASAMLRKLAMSQESLSAQQLAELMDASLRPSVAEIRTHLRANDKTLFTQVRRGGFVLGQHYKLPKPRNVLPEQT